MAKLLKERQEILNKWMNYDLLDQELKEELNSLNEEELFDAFYTDLEFGTGGMRGVIGAGTNRMNIYTLRSANFGFAKYLLENKYKLYNIKSEILTYLAIVLKDGPLKSFMNREDFFENKRELIRRRFIVVS